MSKAEISDIIIGCITISSIIAIPSILAVMVIYIENCFFGCYKQLPYEYYYALFGLSTPLAIFSLGASQIQPKTKAVIVAILSIVCYYLVLFLLSPVLLFGYLYY
jgi:hypothetical protein